MMQESRSRRFVRAVGWVVGCLVALSVGSAVRGFLEGPSPTAVEHPVLQSFVQRIEENPGLAEWVESQASTTAEALALGSRGTPRLDDASLAIWADLMGQVYLNADSILCGMLAMQDPRNPNTQLSMDQYLQVYALLDSTQTDVMSDLSYRALLQSFRQAPIPDLSDEQVESGWGAFLDLPSESEAARLFEVMDPVLPVPASEGCWVARVVYGRQSDLEDPYRTWLIRSLIHQ